MARRTTVIDGHPNQLADSYYRLTCTFTKDRTADIARGRFIDHSYDVLGYAWLHMLAAIRHLIPTAAFTAQLSSAPGDAKLRSAYDERLFMSALGEQASVAIEGHPAAWPPTITGQFPGRPRDAGPAPAAAIMPARIITAHAGETLFTARLAPATGPDGRQLPLNHHLITAERAGRVTHQQVLTDSPMHTAIRRATRTLLSSEPATLPDLSALRRIAAIAAASGSPRTQEDMASPREGGCAAARPGRSGATRHCAVRGNGELLLLIARSGSRRCSSRRP